MSKSNSPKNQKDQPNANKIQQTHLSNFSNHSSILNRQQSSQQNTVSQAKNQLDNLIENLNGKLVNHFKMKQQALLQKYKKELIEQQRQLTQLKNNTNQEQIRNKMLQRKAELQKQRNHLIQTNMFFSQKCQQYKQNYSKLVQDAQDLNRQIKFLDQQIDTANAKKMAMIQSIQQGSQRAIGNQTDRDQLPIFTDKKKSYQEQQYTHGKKIEGPTLEKTRQSNSTRKIAKSLHVSNFSKNTKSNLNIKNKKSLNPQIFQKGLLQKLFQESVEQVKNRRKAKRTMPNLKGEQFTEYEKRAIMEIFLSNEDVKKKIYQIIFENNDKTGRGARADPMIKISFQEIGM